MVLRRRSTTCKSRSNANLYKSNDSFSSNVCNKGKLSLHISSDSYTASNVYGLRSSSWLSFTMMKIRLALSYLVIHTPISVAWSRDKVLLPHSNIRRLACTYV